MKHLWKTFESPLKVPWNTLEISLKLFGNPFQNVHKRPFKLFWISLEALLKYPWNFPEAPLKFSFNTLELIGYFHEVSWSFLETLLWHPWNLFQTPFELPWNTLDPTSHGVSDSVAPIGGASEVPLRNQGRSHFWPYIAI